MSSFFSSSNNSSGSSSSTTSPWQPQQQYLTSGFQSAQNLYNTQTANGQPQYNGELYAQLNPQQLAAMNGLNTYAAGTGTGVANSMTSAGNSTIGGVNSGLNTYNGIAQQTQQDPTKQIVNDAGQYVNNPLVQSEITAANTPIEQELNEQALPQLNMNATATGNANSSRAGVAQAILQRDAATQEANNAATIEGNAYNTGVGTAAGLYGTNLNAGLNAAAGQVNTGSTGANLLDQGYNTTLNNLNIPLQTGGMTQQNQQGQDEANLAQYQLNQQLPWQALSNYWGIVGGTGYGSQSSGTTTGITTNNPSGVQDIGSILGLITSDPRAKVINDGKAAGLYGAQAKDNFIVGARYRDAKGRRAIYRGGGKWQRVM